MQSKTRGTLSRPTVQADVQRIVEIYRRNGRFDVRVEPKIIELPNNRVDLVFEIKEGDKTGVKKIIFVGNKAYGDQRLKDEIKTSETTWIPFIAFLQTADIYDPDRIEADRDLIRRFYLKHGYADVRVVSAVSVYDPEKKGFIVTFTIDEGARYGSARSISSRTSRWWTRIRFTAVCRAAPAMCTTPRRWKSRSRTCRSKWPAAAIRLPWSGRAATAIWQPTPSTSCSSSRTARASTSSGSMSAATPAPATT